MPGLVDPERAVTTTALAVSSSMWLWYVARASGLVSLVLLTGSVLLGIVTSVHWANERWPRFTTSMLHRNLSLAAVVFLVLHVATVVVDGFAPIGWLDAVIPFASPYRTLWLGLGTVAFDLVTALVATSLLRRHVGPRAWRVIHWSAYLCWPVALVHGLGTGTDAASEVGLAVSVVCTGVVVAASWWRLSVAPPGRARGWAVAGSVVVPLVTAAWLVQGPLASGWARRAGTPDALVAGAVSAAALESPNASSSSTTGPPARLTDSFTSSFDGSATSTGSGTAVTLRLSASLPGAANDTISVVLNGSDGDRGLVVRDGTVTIASTAGDAMFVGTLDTVGQGTIDASPSAQSPTQRRVEIRLTALDGAAGTVSGSVRLVGHRSGRDGQGGNDG
jgi:hypothetical protein